MNRPSIFLLFPLLAVGLSTARAQGLMVQKALSIEAAQAVAQGALEKCRADGYKVSVSVVDGSGILKAFVRDDTTGPHTVDLSRRKAFTALTFKRTSAETAKAWATQTPVPNIEGNGRVGRRSADPGGHRSYRGGGRERSAWWEPR